MAETLILDEFSQEEIDAGYRPIFDRFKNKKESDRIKNFIAKNKEKIKDETEIISDEMSNEDKIVRHAEPAPHFPESEKTEKRYEDEKREKAEEKIAAMDGSHLRELEKDLADRRKAFASIEYTDGIKLAEIRKKLGSKNIEESTQVRNSRIDYQKTLDRFKDAKIEELKNKGLTGEALKAEMAELVKYFGFCEVLEVQNARSDAKAESHMGAGMAKKCWGMLEKTSNWYNKLPMWQRLGLAGLGVVGGLALTTGTVASAAAISTVSGLVAAKRVFGSAMAAVGTAKGLDALHQRSVGKIATKDTQKIVEEMDKVDLQGNDEEKVEKRFEIMRAALDVRLENVDKELRKQGMVSVCNKTVGILVGVLLGSGIVSKAFGGAIGSIKEHFYPAENVSGNLGDYKNFKEMNSSSRLAGKDLVASTMAAEHEAPVDMRAPVGPVDTTDALNKAAESVEKTITIEKGSSIEKTLIEHIKATHPDIKNPGHAAHRMWLDYMHDNKAEIVSKYGDGEYQKMLKDGMVNVKPGTTLVLDENNPLKLKLHDIGGKISHLERGHLSGGHAIAPTEVSSGGNSYDPEPDLKISEEILKKKDEIATSLETFQHADQIASGVEIHMDQSGSTHVENVPVDKETVDRMHDIMIENDRSIIRAEKVIAKLTEGHIRVGNVDVLKSLIESNAPRNQIFASCLDKLTEGSFGKAQAWNEIKNMRVEEAIQKNPDMGKKIANIAGGFKDKLNWDKAIPKFKSTETVQQWLARIVGLATKK